MKHNLATEIGNNIKAIRRKRKMTQRELASELNTFQPIISRIERGSFLPSLKYLEKIFFTLDATMEIRVLEN